MFEIYNGQSYLYQWDKNQKLIVYDERVEQVHFANNVLENAIVRDCYTLDGKKVVDVPNKLLETSGRCWAYAYVLNGDEYTLKKEVLTIIEKKKPNDYVEDEEVLKWSELERRITELEKNGGGGGSVDLSAYSTTEENNEKYQPKGSYAPSNHTHSEYATKTQVSELSNQIVNEVNNRENAIQTLSEEVAELKQNGGSGVTSWNDLEDKPFSSELIEDTTLVETQSINLDSILSSGGNIYSTQLNYPLFEIEDGKKYTITWNGVVYECIAELVTIMGTSGYMVGNKSFLTYLSGESFNDNKMPFCIGIMGATMIIGEGGTHTINVRYIEEEIKTLDVKYLPIEDIKNIIDEVINEALNSEV